MSEPAQKQPREPVTAVNLSVPPLNPRRFAKSDRATLLGHARGWFGFDSAFAMCLNVALSRGMENFAAELAAGHTQAPLTQAFYMYRSGGRMQQAMELAAGPITSLIREKAPLPGIVLDAIVTAKFADRNIYENLLNKIVAAKPDLMMASAAHAFLHYEILETFGPEAAEALNPTSTPEGVFEGDIRIAGVATMRNEGPLVAACAESMLRYCDFVLILDHNSEDDAPAQAEAQFGKERVEILRIPGMTVFDEQAVWDRLFDRARERKATHITVADADEILGPALADPAVFRAEARRLRPGEALAVRWPQVFGDGLIDYNKFGRFNDLSRLLPPWKDFLYCDDGKAMHRRMPLHNPRAPEGFPQRRNFINDASAGLIHFEKSNTLNALVKTDYYLAKELLVYQTPLPIVLARYLPVHFINNAAWDSPPAPHALAELPSDAYSRVITWQLNDVKAIAPRISPEMRFLFNLDYWS